MAEAGRGWLLRIPRSADELGRAGCLPDRGSPSLVVDTWTPQRERTSQLGSNEEARCRLAPATSHPSPLAKPEICRQPPEVRAVCIKVHVRIRAGGAGQP